MQDGVPLTIGPTSTLPSPTSATGESAHDHITDFGHDLEKQSFKEKDDGRDERSAKDTQTQSIRTGSLIVRVSTGLLQSLACFATSSEISRQRKEDGERKLVQRSKTHLAGQGVIALWGGIDTLFGNHVKVLLTAVEILVDDHPKGYPQLAAFVDSDENFSIFRKYGFLRNRVLLYRQDELAELERTLITMDEDDSGTNPERLRCRQIDEEMDHDHTGDPIYTRKGLIKAIDDKLKEYDDALQRLHFLSSLRPPTARNTASFTDWNLQYKPLASGDASFLSHRSDMVSLAPTTESNRLDGFVEDCLTTILPESLLRRFLTSDEQKLKSNDRCIRLFSKKRVGILVRLILTAAVVLMLVGPSAVLFLWEGHGGVKVGLICLFTLIFATAVGVGTRAKRHEMLAATAT